MYRYLFCRFMSTRWVWASMKVLWSTFRLLSSSMLSDLWRPALLIRSTPCSFSRYLCITCLSLLQALKYCESISKQVSKKPELFSASLIHLLTEVCKESHFVSIHCNGIYWFSGFSFLSSYIIGIVQLDW